MLMTRAIKFIVKQPVPVVGSVAAVKFRRFPGKPAGAENRFFVFTKGFQPAGQIAFMLNVAGNTQLAQRKALPVSAISSSKRKLDHRTFAMKM
jgi:hypothetical protein